MRVVASRLPRYSFMNCTAIAPSPSADATRLIDPERSWSAGEVRQVVSELGPMHQERTLLTAGFVNDLDLTRPDDMEL